MPKADCEADLALRTDTGGSVGIPAACCGIVGLETTFRRESTRGVAWLIAAGRPLPSTQRRLGHESITTTVWVEG